LKKEDILKGKEILDSTFEKSYNKCKKNEENLNKKRSKEKKDKNKNKDKDVIKDNEKSDEGTILCAGVFNPEKISILLNNDIYIEKKISCPVFDKVFTDELVNKKYLAKSYNKMSEFYSNNSSNNKAMTFFRHGKMLIMGGFFDGKVIFKDLDDKLPPIIITPFKDESPILAIASDKEDEIIFMGNSIGNVGVYKYKEDGLKMVKLLTDQNSPISHIFCSDELNLLATASIDGYICLYTLPLCKLVRCIKVPTDNCTYVFLSDSPLPSIVVISDEDNISQIFVYSINGKFYQKKEEYFKISKPILIKDIYSKDYLTCIGNENIYIISVPDLAVQATFDKLFGVYSFCFSEDKKILYALNKKGTEVTVIKEEKQKFYRSSSYVKK
jgi:WD40 repeat protein